MAREPLVSKVSGYRDIGLDPSLGCGNPNAYWWINSGEHFLGLDVLALSGRGHHGTMCLAGFMVWAHKQGATLLGASSTHGKAQPW